MNFSLYLPSALLDSLSLNLMKTSDKFLSYGVPLFTGAGAYYFIHKAIDKKGLIVGNASWNVLSSILGVTTGFLIWNESLNTKKLLGLGLAIPAIYLMNDA